jgi:tetratricopeptide (TPR) repeat protein
MTFSQQGRTEEAVETMERAYRLAKDAGDVSVLLRVYNNFPTILSTFGSDHRRALDVLREGIELARRAGGIGYLAWFLGTLSDITTDLGDLEEAERAARESLALAEEVGDEPLRGIRLNQLAWIVFQRGSVGEAAELQQRSVAILDVNPEPQGEVFLFVTDGAIALAQGRQADALGHLRRGVEMARGFTPDFVPLMFYELVRLLLRTGDRAAADGYRDLSSPGRSPATHAFAVAIDGLLEEDAARAADLLAEAAAAFERMGMRIAQGRVLIDLGEALARGGRDPRLPLEQARDLLEACDARIYLPDVERLLAAAPHA